MPLKFLYFWSHGPSDRFKRQMRCGYLARLPLREAVRFG